MEKARVKPNLNIYKKLSANNQNENIQNILELNKNIKEFQIDFLYNNNIEKKLEVCGDDLMGNFIKCSYNKLGDSYRSPWTNKFFPELKEPVYPPEIFREFEKSFNEIYALYAKLYYGNDAISSVFIWEQGESLDNGFNVALLIDNTSSNNQIDENAGKINFTGTINKQIEEGTYVKSLLDINGHVEKIGKLIESVENSIRASLDEVYLKKAKEIIVNTRKSNNELSIPSDYLKTKNDVINGMQEYWQNKMNFESNNNNYMSSHSRTPSNLNVGTENIGLQNSTSLGRQDK